MLKGMFINDKVVFIVDIFIKKFVLFEKFEYILLGVFFLILIFKIKLEINMFIFFWVLDSILKVF